MSYVSWFGSVRSNSVRPVRSGPVRLGPNPFRPVRFGPVRFEPNPSGPVRLGPVRSEPNPFGPVRLGPVRFEPILCLYALLSVNLLIQEIYLAYQIIPSTVS